MKNFLKIVITVVFAGVSIPYQVFAVAEFQSFGASLSLNSSCQPVLTYSATITPASITTGNSFVVSVSPLTSQNESIEGSNQDYPVSVPANGLVSNQTMSITQSINVLTNYEVQMHEYSGTGSFITSSSPDIVTPTQGSCVNPNAQTEAPSNDPPSLEYMDIEIENPISVNSIPDLIQTILEGLIKIGIPLLVVMIVYSGWLYLFARGDPGKIKDAHNMFLYTLVGGAILLAAWALAELIHSTLIDLTASVFKFFV